jgi:RimJ/RimL family protein N-acetyltransferase
LWTKISFKRIGSEPLSFEEEIKMQQSWKNDEEKCTFIILAKSACSTSEFIKEIEEGNIDEDDSDCANDFDFIHETLDVMIGDVNLFLSDIEEDIDDDNVENDIVGDESSNAGVQAELDIMIAEDKYRKLGMGTEASLMMMLYGAQNLRIRKYIVKVKEENVASRNMFEKLGFKECNYAACFKEYELELICSSSEEMVKTIQILLQKPFYKWKCCELK